MRRAIGNLRDADVLDPHALYEVPEEELEELIRPAGYYRVKAKRLRSLLKFFVERYDGSIEAMFRTPLDELRRQLLGIHGVGPRKQPILLYAGSLPIFVVDAYTYRIFSRHGWIDLESDYHQIQEYFHDHLPADDPCSTNSTPCWSTWKTLLQEGTAAVQIVPARKTLAERSRSEKGMPKSK